MLRITFHMFLTINMSGDVQAAKDSNPATQSVSSKEGSNDASVSTNDTKASADTDSSVKDIDNQSNSQVEEKSVDASKLENQKNEKAPTNQTPENNNQVTDKKAVQETKDTSENVVSTSKKTLDEKLDNNKAQADSSKLDNDVQQNKGIQASKDSKENKVQTQTLNVKKAMRDMSGTKDINSKESKVASETDPAPEVIPDYTEDYQMGLITVGTDMENFDSSKFLTNADAIKQAGGTIAWDTDKAPEAPTLEAANNGDVLSGTIKVTYADHTTKTVVVYYTVDQPV